MGTAINELGTKQVMHHNAASANGNGERANVGAFGLHVMQVEITGTATVHFEGTMDGQTWFPLRAVNLATGAQGTSTTSSGLFQMSCAGLEYVRARISDVSGTPSVTVIGRSLPVSPGDAAGASSALLETGQAKVTLSGSTVVIGGTSFQVSNGYVIRGKSTDKPSASDAHAAIPNAVYWSIDSGDVEVTDGTQWVEV